MDTRTSYRELIKRIILEYARIQYAHGDIQRMPVFDQEGDHYLLMIVGREGIRRVHRCIIHVDIINGKFWIQRDGIEYGIGQELLDAGVPHEHIVPAYRLPEVRKDMGFAVS